MYDGTSPQDVIAGVGRACVCVRVCGRVRGVATDMMVVMHYPSTSR